MTPAGLLPLLLIATIAAAWWTNLRARGVALAYGRRACQRYGFELLDHTVALERYRLRRDRTGRLRLGRVYTFDFSAPDQERGHGWVSLLGHRVVAVQVDRSDGGADYDLPSNG